MFFPHLRNLGHGGIGDTPDHPAFAVGDALNVNRDRAAAELDLPNLIPVAGQAVIEMTLGAVTQRRDVQYILLGPDKRQSLGQLPRLVLGNLLGDIAQVKVHARSVIVPGAHEFSKTENSLQGGTRRGGEKSALAAALGQGFRLLLGLENRNRRCLARRFIHGVFGLVGEALGCDENEEEG